MHCYHPIAPLSCFLYPFISYLHLGLDKSHQLSFSSFPSPPLFKRYLYLTMASFMGLLGEWDFAPSSVVRFRTWRKLGAWHENGTLLSTKFAQRRFLKFFAELWLLYAKFTIMFVLQAAKTSIRLYSGCGPREQFLHANGSLADLMSLEKSKFLKKIPSTDFEKILALDGDPFAKKTQTTYKSPAHSLNSYFVASERCETHHYS